MKTCNTNITDLGAINCFNELGALRRLILMPLFDADGDANEWADKDAFTKSALQTKINSADIRDRIFPTEFLNNVEENREDVKVETDDFDIDHFIRHGVKSFQAIIFGASFTYLSNLSSLNFLSGWGVIGIDTNGNILHKTDSATKTKVQPIPIRSFYVADVSATSESVSKGMLKFKYALDGNDYLNLSIIKSSELDFDALSSTDLYSLEDVELEVSAQTIAGATVTAYVLEDGTKYPVYGLTAFTCLKGASPVVVTVASASEGVYTLTWTTTAGDHTITASADGYDIETTSFTVSGS